jgi:hypothetical protein
VTQLDSFTFRVPNSYAVTGIFLNGYQQSNSNGPNNKSYFAFTQGSAFSRFDTDAGYLISKLINSNAIGLNLLAATVGSPPPQTSVSGGLLGSGQLNSGNYSLLLRDSGADVAYTFNLVLESTTFFSFAAYTQFQQISNKPTAPYTPVAINGIQLGQLFDETYYLTNNTDVNQAIAAKAFRSGFEHFTQYGLAEGRDPSILFNKAFYYQQNQDVKTAVDQGIFSSAIEHYLLFGAAENRDPSSFFDTTDYLLANPDVKTAVTQQQLTSGFEHYVKYGALEGRTPNLFLFQESFYRANNPDVNQAIGNGLFSNGFEHYIRFGQGERRNPSSIFNESAYLQNNPDVATAIPTLFSSGFEHFLKIGRAEGREAAAVI